MRAPLLIPLLVACSAPPSVGPGGDTGPGETLQTVDLAVDLAAQGAETWPPELLSFDWIPTVWAFGIHRLHARTADPAWQAYYRGWMDDALEDFDPAHFVSSDSVSPAVLAATLMAEDPALDYATITDAADAYIAQAPRTAQGAIAHWGPDNPWGFDSDQVWVDSQFMVGVYMVRQLERTGNLAWRDAFVYQYLAFSEVCRDPADQLYRHAYDDSTGENIPTEAAYWARGNAWVLVSAAELLATVGPDDEAWPLVQPLFAEHAAATLALQADDGLWRTVLNSPRGEDPDNYTETSASALVAYAFARGIRAGALPADGYAPAVARAVAGLEDRLYAGTDGRLHLEGTSMGTNPGDYEMYVGVPQVDDLMLGYGAVVMALAEVQGLPVAP